MANKIKYYIWLRVLPLKLLVFLRDKKFNSLSKSHKLIRSFLFPKQFLPGYDFFTFDMNEELANFIKHLRVSGPRSHTWRAVAREVAAKFPHLDVQSGDQMDGQDLCRYAMVYLKESEEEGWN
jgi:hypothetical protein